MNEFLSNKFKTLNAFALLCVAYIHAYNFANNFLESTTRVFEGLNIFVFIEYFISNGITRFAIPVFSFISGYLVFIKWKNSFEHYINLVIKRVKSLLIPFIIWSIFWAIAVYLLYKNNIRNSLITSFTESYIANPFNIFSSPAGFQFWYFRDLFKIMLITPLIYLINKPLKGLLNIAFIYMYIFNISIYVNNDILLFFSVGAYFALNDKLQKSLLNKAKSKKMTMILLIMAVSVSLGFTFLSCGWEYFETSNEIRNLIYKCMQVLLTIGVFRAYDFFDDLNILPSLYLQNTIMVFALHEPLQQILAFFILKGSSNYFINLLVYFILPLLVIILASKIGYLLRRYCPFMNSVLTGGR